MPNSEFLTPEDFNDTSLVPDTPLVGAVMEQAMQVNPDQQAKDMKLSRASGIPVDAVKVDPAQVERNVRMQQFDFNTFGQKNPATEAFYSDLAKASLAHDDVHNLSALEQTLTPFASVTQAGMSIEEGVLRVPQFAEDLTKLASQNLETLGLPRVVNPVRGLEMIASGWRMIANPWAEQFRKARQELPNVGKPFQRLNEVNQQGDVAFDTAVKGDFKPLMSVLADPEAVSTYAANALPSLMVAVASGGSIPVVMGMEGSSELTSQADYAAQHGEIPLADRVQATIQTAVINGMLEKFGIDYLRRFPVFKKFFKEADAAGVKISDVLKTMGAEAGTETLQQLNQNIAEALTYNPDQSLTSGVLQSAIGGAGGGGVAGGFGYAHSRAYSKVEQSAFDPKAQVNEGEQSIIDKMNHYASQSATRGRDPETFREFVQGINTDANVYIDGEAVQKYMQEQKGEDAKVDPALQLLTKELEKNPPGADVSIPVADFATDIAGTKHFDALREHMKLDPESSTPARQAENEKEMQSFVDRTMNEAKQNASTYAESQDIFAKVRDQLIDTGRVSPQQAGVMADIVPAWATVQAQSRGIPVSQVYAESGLKIEGPMTGEMSKLSAAALEQPTKIYHGTTKEAAKLIESEGFDTKKSADGTVWFTSNPKIGDVAATGKGAVVSRILDESALKLGGWGENDKYSTDELIAQGYDGLKLEDGDETTYQIFNPDKLGKVVEPLAQPSTSSDLYVAHNLSADNLRHAAELGGLAAPSLAVARTGKGTFEGFGEITLLADPSILSSSKARTFDADVYTPRHPRAVYTLDSKKFDAMLRKLEAETAEAGQLDMPSRDDIEQRGPENMLYSTAMRYYFLKGKGKAPKAKQMKVQPWVKKAAALGLKGEYSFENSPEFEKILRDHFNQQAKKIKADPELKDFADELTDWFNEDGTVDERVIRENARVAARYIENNGIDSSAMRADIDKALRNKKLSEEYQAYVTEQFNSIKTGAKIFKGFTDSGNRKYVEYNIENIVKEMTRALQGGEGFNYGAGSLRAKYANEMKTVKQVQARREQIVSPAEFEKIKDESQNKVVDALDELRPFYKYDSTRFGYMDDAISAIGEGPKGWREAFNLDDDSRKIITDLIDYMKTLPTEYFETKIGRAVQLSEFNTAVVPKNAPADVLQILKNAGVKVKKYADSEQRAKIVADQQHLLFQQARGYYDPSQSLIRLTEASNLSTFLHEFAHFMYDMEKKNPNSKYVEKIHQWFKRNADDVAMEANGYRKREGASLEQGPITKKAGPITAQHVVDYLDNGTSGDKVKDEAIERAVHEQFARGFEKYLMEGVAPSVELRNVFRTFARWLVQVYKSIKGDLQVNLDDEMRQVFARMVATDEQINAAEARTRFEPMFTDAAMAGMTEEEFAKYKEKQSKAKDKATETLRDKLIKQLTRQTEAWWKTEKADIVQNEIETLKRERVYAAADKLRNGEFKLDHGEVKERYGVERTDKLGRKMTRIPDALIGLTAQGGLGVRIDDAAAFLGYGSGDEMVQDLMTARPIKAKAEEIAQQKMLDKHGDILTDGTIEKEADEAVQNEERGEMILAELKVLSKGTRRASIDRTMLKSMAEDAIGKMNFREIQPGKYRAAELRAAQESARMLAEGNKEGAASAKARQALNYYLGMAATAAKNDTMKIVDRMARYRRKDVKEAILKAENGYWGQIEKILERFEFRKGATLRQVDTLNESLRTWMKARIEDDGDAIVLSPAVLDEGYRTHWKNVPYNELVGINDSVKNLEHVARYSNKITGMREEIDFQQLVQRWTSSMNEKASDKFKSQRTDVAEGKNWGRWAMAQMTKIPFLASWLDGGERAGMSHDILVQPFTDAYNAEVLLWDEVGSVVMNAIKNRSKEDIKRHNQKLFIKEIKDDVNDGNLMGHQVLAVALNTGNEGNLKKMLLGEGWANPDNESEINFNNPKLQAVLKHMTKSDWGLVQKIWDQMDLLYPQLAEVHRRTTGLTPPKVEAAAVKTPFGEFKGGYYPVKYDPNRSFRAEQNEDRLNAQTESMFGQVGIQASVNASATNERTGYYAPIRLSLDVVPNHFQETIHYITHHDAVRQVNKLIRNKTVAETIKSKLGPEEYAQLKPWLNDIAKDGREAPTKMFWEDILQRLRFGMTLGVMGFKASTGLMQLLGMTNTMAEVGSANVYQAVRSIVGSPKDMQAAWNFAAANSKVMSHRTETMDREIKNAMHNLQGKRGLMAAVQETSMKHIALIQTYLVDLPSWHAAYIKGMKEWGDEARAYKYADWVVENVQGSGVTKDMAQIMRNQSQVNRTFTMFMTFFSSLWNIERDLVRGASSGLYSKSSTAAKLMFVFALPVYLQMLMQGDFGGDNKDDKESALQKYLTQLALYPIQSVPFLRDFASPFLTKYGYNISPVAQLIEQGTQSIPKLATAPFTDKEIKKSQVKGASKFIGAAAGVPGVNQAWATGEHLYDVLKNGEDLTLRELLYGPDKKK